MKLGIFFFDGAESIDVATFGVLSIAKRVAPQLEMLTFAPRAGIVHMANGFKMIADYGIHDNNVPQVDAMVIIGGATWPEINRDQAVLDFIVARSADTIIASVCTGGMILAATGLLDGKMATTRCQGNPGEDPTPIQRIGLLFPKVIPAPQYSIIDYGNVITGGGVCLCIDMMMHLLQRQLGTETANRIAVLLEYQRAWDANRADLPVFVA